MIIEVTRKDIEDGLPSLCSACPIALAVQRRGFPHARTSNDGWRLILASGQKIWLPRSARMFIETFDTQPKAAKPFSFSIDLPEAKP